MLFDKEAYAAMARLDETAPEPLLDRIDAALDELEANPGARRVRGRRFANPPVWAITVSWANYRYMILWDFDLEGEVRIRAVVQEP